MIAREQTASIGRRTWAFTIDSLVMSLFVLILFYDSIMALADKITMAVTPEQMNEVVLAVSAFNRQSLPYIFLLYVLYHGTLVWLTGMTLGKYVLHLRVVRLEDGRGLSFGMAFLRALIRSVGELFLFYITFLPAFFSPLRQTLHDRLSGSVVIDLRAAA